VKKFSCGVYKMSAWFFNNNPWGQPKQDRPADKGTPSFETAFEDFIKRLKGKLSSGKKGSGGPEQKAIVVGALVVFFLVYLASGIYTVKEAEQAVVVRLGKYKETLGAGLRYHYPFPFEEVHVRNVAANNYLSSEDRTNQVQREQNDFYMLTGDENLVEMDKYTIHWRIKDLRKFLFNIRAQEAVIIATADSVLREVIAKTPINLIITERRAQVNEEVTQLLQELLDKYEAGVHIVEFIMQKADPPEPVMDAFIDVTRAEADRERSQHEARGYRDEILPKARSIAKQTQLESEAYAQEVVARSEGEAGRFEFLCSEYSRSPDGLAMRLYLEAMETVLSGATKLLVDPSAGVPVQSYLPLPALAPAKKQAKAEGAR
jgi:membrane protease subunit HflK